ncbi:MAG: hypothetical protein H6905_00905 [Hyphomicrobiales bacterium]|nr:hypothetical protein [Hyphomicrobiales bacterium]
MNDGVFELRRIMRATDLWAPLEMAQFGRIVLHDERKTDARARALDAFLTTFSEVTENWDETTDAVKGPVLEGVFKRVSALADTGLFVHVGCIEQRFAEGDQGVRLPVAIIAVSPSQKETITVSATEDAGV